MIDINFHFILPPIAVPSLSDMNVPSPISDRPVEPSDSQNNEGKPQRACKGKRYKEIVAESGLKALKRERKVVHKSSSNDSSDDKVSIPPPSPTRLQPPSPMQPPAAPPPVRDPSPDNRRESQSSSQMSVPSVS